VTPGYVLPYVEYNIQVIYKVTGVAVFCLSSHEQIINSFNSTFAQQATDTCNNKYADTGTLEITDIKSTTSSFSVRIVSQRNYYLYKSVDPS
jgi:hypothetical protein